MWREAASRAGCVFVLPGEYTSVRTAKAFWSQHQDAPVQEQQPESSKNDDSTMSAAMREQCLRVESVLRCLGETAIEVRKAAESIDGKQAKLDRNSYNHVYNSVTNSVTEYLDKLVATIDSGTWMPSLYSLEVSSTRLASSFM